MVLLLLVIVLFLFFVASHMIAGFSFLDPEGIALDSMFCVLILVLSLLMAPHCCSKKELWFVKLQTDGLITRAATYLRSIMYSAYTDSFLKCSHLQRTMENDGELIFLPVSEDNSAEEESSEDTS